MERSLYDLAAYIARSPEHVRRVARSLGIEPVKRRRVALIGNPVDRVYTEEQAERIVEHFAKHKRLMHYERG